MLIIALSKGRILKQALLLLKKFELTITAKELNGRKLIFNTSVNTIKLIIVRAVDVPIFVQHGVADAGIVGKDVLLEHGAYNLFELLDLNIAKCSLILAAESSEKLLTSNTLKVATKYVRSSKNYFATKNQQVEIIKLYGSIELAPKVGLADCIIDLTDTGDTLKANGLIPLAHIADISSRLIVNSASFKTKNKQIKTLINNIKKHI